MKNGKTDIGLLILSIYSTDPPCFPGKYFLMHILSVLKIKKNWTQDRHVSTISTISDMEKWCILSLALSV